MAGLWVLALHVVAIHAGGKWDLVSASVERNGMLLLCADEVFLELRVSV